MPQDTTKMDVNIKENFMAGNMNEDAVKHLNTLISTNKDSQKGYQEAAEEAENGEYKSLFNEYAGQRGRFASELQSEVRSLGGEPTESGSAAAAAHRVWLDVRNAVSRARATTTSSLSASGARTWPSNATKMCLTKLSPRALRKS